MYYSWKPHVLSLSKGLTVSLFLVIIPYNFSSPEFVYEQCHERESTKDGVEANSLQRAKATSEKTADNLQGLQRLYRECTWPFVGPNTGHKPKGLNDQDEATAIKKRAEGVKPYPHLPGVNQSPARDQRSERGNLNTTRPKGRVSDHNLNQLGLTQGKGKPNSAHEELKTHI